MFLRVFLLSAAFPALIGSAQAQIALERPVLAQPLPTKLLPSAEINDSTTPARLADGFDFPVGKPDAVGYYKARGFSRNNHPGEDWNGVGGGDSDLDDAINSIGDGLVVLARDARRGWGNVVLVRYQFSEAGQVKTIDALYAHLDSVFVRPGETVARGQQIGTMGTAHGRYPAHLHFEIRKNLAIGINRAAFPCDFSCYYDPTKFIAAHRPQRRPGASGLYACAHTLGEQSVLVALAHRRATASRSKLRRSAPLAF